MRKKIPFLVLIILILVFTFSCKSNNSGEGAAASSTTKSDSSEVMDSKENQASQDDSSKEENDEDQTYYPSDFENKSILIVPNIDFHGDGREEIEAKSEWMGLFKTKSGFYLKNVKANVKKVYDPISDNENGPYSGVKVVPSINKGCELLLNPIGGMKEGELNCFLSKEKTMFPGDEISFNCNNSNYQILCLGNETSKDENAEIKGYKLIISSDKQDESKILMEVPPSNEYVPNRISVYLIALIDNDNVPDLVLKLNNEDYFLYLSSYANEGEIVTPVGREVLFGGC